MHVILVIPGDCAKKKITIYNHHRLVNKTIPEAQTEIMEEGFGDPVCTQHTEFQTRYVWFLYSPRFGQRTLLLADIFPKTCPPFPVSKR